VLKPGGHLLSFAGTRTQHRMAVNIEDAGFEIRDMIAWVYGSGFPKSHNIGKAVDKCNGEGGRLLKFTQWFRTAGLSYKEATAILVSAGVISEKGTMAGHYYAKSDSGQPAIPTVELWKKLRPYIKIEIPKWVDELVDRIEAEREVIGKKTAGLGSGKTYAFTDENINAGNEIDITAPATEEAKKYEGWGTALKPALEPITVARKPFKGTVANNVLKWGTGGINIDGCRVESGEDMSKIKAFGSMPEKKVDGKGFSRPWMNDKQAILDKQNRAIEKMKSQGRFPANLIHDGSDEVVGLFPETNKQAKCKSDNKSGWQTEYVGGSISNPTERKLYLDKENGGSAARFFYCAKASKSERNEGCEEIEEKQTWASQTKRESNSFDVFESDGRPKTLNKNNHPTVKPVKLMQYLVRLVTPKDGTVLDPFMGSGSTGKACMIEGFDFIGIELAEDYFEIAKARIEKLELQHELFEK